MKVTFYVLQFQVCQGGDFINTNGTGGKSIYSKKYENFNFQVNLKHGNFGSLSMKSLSKLSPCIYELKCNQMKDANHSILTKFFIDLIVKTVSLQ